MSRSRVVSRFSAAMALATVGLVAAAPPPALGGPEVVRLHIAPDGSTATFTFGAATQSLLPLTRCEISGTAGPLIKLSAGNRKVGMSSNGIGVKSGGSQGTPCGRTDTTETLTLTTKGTAALNGRLMHKLVLDLELKGNAWVKLSLTRDGVPVVPNIGEYQLQTGSSIQPDATPPTPGPPYMATSTAGAPKAACANPSDSGPDSGSNDNCLWTVDPGADFDTATFTVMVGEFSLEGSGDFGGNPAYDTLLHLSNRAPVAVDDVLTTDEDTPLSANVLGNDSDPDSDPISITEVNGATPPSFPATIPLTGGSATLAADGALNFTPTLNFNGAAGSFTYTIADSEGATASALVSIAVNAVNDPPVATGGPESVDEDGSVNIPIATDVENDPLTVSCTEPANGSVVDIGDGSITYTPDPNFNGSDSFDCTANDGQDDSNTVTITVAVTPVNDPPVAADDVAETDEDVDVVIDVLDNDTDIDGDTLVVTAVTQGADGTVTITNDGADLTYTPDPGFVGTDTFTYTASDGFASDTATVTVETFQTICSDESVTVTDDDVTGTFTRLADPEDCKRYVAEADQASGTVLFQPEGTSTVKYRAVLQLGSSSPPPPSPPTPVNLFLEYDPTGGDSFQPVQWCIAPMFDGSGNVTDATLPPGETWCIASAYTAPGPGGVDLVTTWQVYGEDDPKFR